MKLYELTEQYKELSAMLDQEEVDPQAVADTLESLTGEFEEKADNLACIIKDCLSDAEALKNEAAALEARHKTKKAKADWLIGYLYQQMCAVGKREIETTRNLLKIKNTPPSVKIADLNAFIAWATLNHEEFLRQKAPEVDKTAVKNAVRQGRDLPGVTLEGGEKLSIK